MPSGKSDVKHFSYKVVPALVMFCFCATTALAALKVVGTGNETRFDPAEIPVNKRQSFQLMESRCTSCHSSERLVIAIQSGIAPITGQPFDATSAKVFVKKIASKPDSNINEVEMKEILDILNFLLIKQSASKQP